MNRTLLAFSVSLLLASPAMAQETYSVSLPLSQVTQLDLGRVQQNNTVCASASLPNNCTQAQVCQALAIGTPDQSTPPNYTCTAGDANAAGKRIYNNNQTAREAFVTLELVKPPLASYVAKQAEIGLLALKNFCLSANQTQQDAICTASGQSAGCSICLAFR